MERRIVLGPRERAGLEREAAATRDARLRTRLLIIVHSGAGWSRPRIAAALRCDVGTISDVRRRGAGRAGLTDGRVFNGTPKVDADFRGAVEWILTLSPPDFGHRRPTWTQLLLIATARRYTGVEVSTTTMGRVLKRLGARLGRPKPVAPCPWSGKARRARMGMLRRLTGSILPHEACVWEDEVDLDLNPKIGRDWMLPGTQRRVATPGKNAKRYLAIALNDRDGRLCWVGGERKNSDLFIALLRKLLRRHPGPLHVILDNYTIHSSARTLRFVRAQPRLRLHFLPPYSPDDNRIEREICRELHANVTVNHHHADIDDLRDAADAWLNARSRRAVADSSRAI
jgi:transposase